MRTLDAAESRLAAWRRALERPRPYLAASVVIVLLALAVRLPLVADARDVCCGHPDSWVYFHQAYSEYMNGRVTPDGHRGSGWQLMLWGTLSAFGFEPAQGWTPYNEPMTGEHARAALVAHALSASLAVGAAAATLLLARDLLPRPAALLAGLLVAVDPFLLRLSTSAMSEPLYVPLFVLGTLTTLRARRHPAWLLATGAVMALGHVMRVNGLVMFAALLVWAIALIGFKRAFRWGAIAGVVFLLVASPYLAWRQAHLSHALDYGTNQRFWADDLWNLNDEWWTAYTPKEGAPRETMADYFAKHDWRDATVRLWQSIEWQIFDLVGSGRWPAHEEEGGLWVGSPREESALTPLVAGLALVAAFTVFKRREWWFLPIALGFTFLTFVWIYPLVRSVRYFAALVPLFTLAAVAGYLHLAREVKRPHLVAAGVFGAWFVVYAGLPILHVPRGLALVFDSPEVRVLAAISATFWILVALAPAARPALSRLRTRRATPARSEG